MIASSKISGFLFLFKAPVNKVGFLFFVAAIIKMVNLMVFPNYVCFNYILAKQCKRTFSHLINYMLSQNSQVNPCIVSRFS